MNRIFVNKSLNMPTGKKIAQVAHGAMRLLTDRFQEEGDFLILKGEESLNWFFDWKKSNFKVQIIESDFSDKFERDIISPSIVTDRGRTVFNGVYTKTVISSPGKKIPSFTQSSIPDNREDEARQIFIINLSQDLSEIEVLEVAAKLSVINILRMAKIEENKITISLKENVEFMEWIFSGYAKIALRAKSNQKMINLIEKLKIKENISFEKEESETKEISAICIGISRKSKTDEITGSLRLF